MIDSLLDKNLSKKFNSLAKSKAKIQKKEDELCKKFMYETDKDTIFSVLDIVDKNGHPNEQKISKDLRAKYISKENFSANDILSLEALYKSNYRNINNKGD